MTKYPESSHLSGARSANLRSRIPAFLLALLLTSLCGSAAVVCVGPAATGNGSGSDWSNLKAWSAVPVRGDTWYLADGAYSAKTFNVPVNGTLVIGIKKATKADHATSTGWIDTMGDGVATFNSGLEFTTSNWVFDGQSGGGPSSWAKNFGFQITCVSDTMANIRIGYNSTANNITVKHVELIGKGSVSNSGGGYSNDAIAIYGDSDIKVAYAWIHGAGRCPLFASTSNSLFEFIYVESYYGSSAVHSEVASIWNFGGGAIGEITFRNSLVTALRSTGGLMFDNSSTPSSHFYIYGNVFYKPQGVTWDVANGVIGGWTGGGGEEMHNVLVYNNTFINIDQSTLSTLPNVFSGCQAFNNLWYNCSSPSFVKFPSHDYNEFINSGGAHGEVNGSTPATSDPFVDFVGLDFRLKANTSGGKDMGLPYNIDPYGKPRTTWSRGAYEFASDSGLAPSAPKNPRVSVP